MQVKQCYISGAHVKVGYLKSYSSFEDLFQEGMPKKHAGIEFLVCNAASSLPAVHPFQGTVRDDIGFRRHLLSSAEIHFGSPRKRRVMQFDDLYDSWEKVIDSFDRLLLMNDEVVWQWKTGSPLCYRFESCLESEHFFFYLLEKAGIQALDGIQEVKVRREEERRKGCYEVGDYVKFTEDFLDVSTLESGFQWHAGDVIRVYNAGTSPEEEGSWVQASGVDDVTQFRIPGSGGAKMLCAIGKIPAAVLEPSSWGEWLGWMMTR